MDFVLLGCTVALGLMIAIVATSRETLKKYAHENDHAVGSRVYGKAFGLAAAGAFIFGLVVSGFEGIDSVMFTVVSYVLIAFSVVLLVSWWRNYRRVLATCKNQRAARTRVIRKLP